MKPSETDEVIYSLEHKMLDRGVQVFSAFGKEAIDTALRADLVVLNTAVAGKWLDYVLKEDVHRVLPKVLWWIHEMRGHYFKLEYVKHLPSVAGAMIDSHVTAEYWKNRTQERLKIKMPETYVVHLGNSNELMQVAEDSVAKRVLREHVRESLGVRNDDLLFALINSVSRGKGQDLFLRSFYEALQLIKQKKMQVPPLHAVIVGSDMSAHTKLEMELRDYVTQKKIQDRVHFVNKTLTVAPYLAAVDVLVQNSQGRGECFGRITIEAMAFQLPVLTGNGCRGHNGNSSERHNRFIAPCWERRGDNSGETYSETSYACRAEAYNRKERVRKGERKISRTSHGRENW
ncbi:hypothetical protein E1A91_A11G195800v1 [Gossypium mustelinum]|nr:hypothetical protein E1A91_A11G195800v1 [Gossypium mustelinum]TYJ10264.1 hypothetical protein E1A91_A11G195800v1 [Gossypium mustelinum]